MVGAAGFEPATYYTNRKRVQAPSWRFRAFLCQKTHVRYGHQA